MVGKLVGSNEKRPRRGAFTSLLAERTPRPFQKMAHSNGQVSHYCSAGFESRFGIRTRDHVAPEMGVNGRFIGPVVPFGASALLSRNWGGERAFHGLHATL